MGRIRTNILLFGTLSAAMVGCVKQPVAPLPSSVNADSISEDQPPVDGEKARVISDLIVDDLIHDRRHKLRERMEKGFREYYDEESMGTIVDLMFDTYGKPLEAEYKIDEGGWKTALGGYSKPMRKFWYAARTTKHKKGTHFITVEIVPDEGGLASSGYAIVTFPLGVVPDNLK